MTLLSDGNKATKIWKFENVVHWISSLAWWNANRNIYLRLDNAITAGTILETFHCGCVFFIIIIINAVEIFVQLCRIRERKWAMKFADRELNQKVTV